MYPEDRDTHKSLLSLDPSNDISTDIQPLCSVFVLSYKFHIKMS